jgi:hypothetical protein
MTTATLSNTTNRSLLFLPYCTNRRLDHQFKINFNSRTLLLFVVYHINNDVVDALLTTTAALIES